MFAVRSVSDPVNTIVTTDRVDACAVNNRTLLKPLQRVRKIVFQDGGVVGVFFRQKRTVTGALKKV